MHDMICVAPLDYGYSGSWHWACGTWDPTGSAVATFTPEESKSATHFGHCGMSRRSGQQPHGIFSLEVCKPVDQNAKPHPRNNDKKQVARTGTVSNLHGTCCRPLTPELLDTCYIVVNLNLDLETTYLTARGCETNFPSMAMSVIHRPFPAIADLNPNSWSVPKAFSVRLPH